MSTNATDDVVLAGQEAHVLCLTLNRPEKRNAFDDLILKRLKHLLEDARQNPHVRVVVLKAHGQHFCAGADLGWMQKMADFSEEENLDDARVLADLMHMLYHFPKPTVSMVQGAAMGGGAGLVACTDIAIATPATRFCFSEVLLGLIPAVISPYVIKAMGERKTLALFMTAQTFNGEKAKEWGLVHEIVSEEKLHEHTMQIAHYLSKLAPNAVANCKKLVREIAELSVDKEIGARTAAIIAKTRVSAEGQTGLKAFLNKETPIWD